MKNYFLSDIKVAFSLITLKLYSLTSFLNVNQRTSGPVNAQLIHGIYLIHMNNQRVGAEHLLSEKKCIFTLHG